MPEINAKQAVLILVALLSFLSSATAQLTDVFGAVVAKDIVSIANLLTGMTTAIMTPFLSNTSTFKDASQLKGVENIQINKQASAGLAMAAVDPTVSNVEPVKGQEAAVTQIAEGVK